MAQALPPRRQSRRDLLRVHVIAPAGPVPAEKLRRGLSCLKQLARRTGIELELSLAANMTDTEGYLAGNDEIRRQTLETAYMDQDCDVLWTARGGFGTTRILDSLRGDWVRSQPRSIVGFSDISALHAWNQVHGGPAGIHGPGVCQLPDLDPRDAMRCFDLVIGDQVDPLAAQAGTSTLGGVIRGPSFVSNLELLRSLVGTPQMPDLRGYLLGLEEVGEAKYRVDRSLTQLLASGVLRGVKAVFVGQMSRRDGEDGSITVASRPELEDLVVERLAGLRVPIVTGFPFGHAAPRNAAIPVGAEVELDVAHAELRCPAPVVEFS